jgi:glycosyltransferase involved in cell wall biosynthesis
MRADKKHIVFICSRLDLPGGIERAIVNTANLLASNDHHVTLLILDQTDKSFYPFHSFVNSKQYPVFFGMIEKGNVITRKLQFLKDIRKLNSILKELKVDVVIATEYPFAIAAAMCGAKKYSRVYSWEHHHYNWLQKSSFWKILYETYYKNLDGIICLNKTEADHYKQFAPTTVIPNFVENDTGKQSSLEQKTILSVGWLIHRKGIDFIMQAAKQVLAKYADWKWKIIGEGELKDQVVNFVETENLQGKLILQQPTSSNLDAEYSNASLFVLASRFEAFPMVLLEAMSFGVPCISFDCPSGPSDIITNNEDGILVEKENPQKLAEAIMTLIEEDLLRLKMGTKAFINVQRFSPEWIYKLWEELLF